MRIKKLILLILLALVFLSCEKEDVERQAIDKSEVKSPDDRNSVKKDKIQNQDT